MKLKSISCIKRSPCHILSADTHRTSKHKTSTINSIQHLPKQMVHQHAGTLSGKPFSCWVDFIREEMQNIPWFQILQSSNNTPLPQRAQNLCFMFTELKQSQKILPFLSGQEEFSLSIYSSGMSKITNIST